MQALLAGLAVASLGGAAEREVAVADAPRDGPVVVVSGAENVPLMVVFDAPIARQGLPVGGPLGEVRSHPALAHTLLVIPSKALAERGAVLMSVPLENGVVRLMIVFDPQRADHVVRVVRRPVGADAGGTVLDANVQAGLAVAAGIVLQGESCGSVESSGPQPRKIDQQSNAKGYAIACVHGGLSYLRMTRELPACPATMARLVRGQQSVDVLVVETASTCGKGTCQRLVVRTPPEPARDFQLELLKADGTLCERYAGLTLEPAEP